MLSVFSFLKELLHLSLHKSFGLSGNMSVRTLPSPLTLDDFELGVTLGTGSFGRVRFCTHKVRLMETLYLLSLKFNILTHAIYFLSCVSIYRRIQAPSGR